MFIDVDVTPNDDGEVALLPEGIAELTARWCVALNRMRKVKDFRPGRVDGQRASPTASPVMKP